MRSRQQRTHGRQRGAIRHVDICGDLPLKPLVLLEGPLKLPEQCG